MATNQGGGAFCSDGCAYRFNKVQLFEFEAYDTVYIYTERLVK